MIHISTPADWPTLRRSGLTTLLDPLTFRAAETFLRGAPPQGHEVLWEALSKNVDALSTFVDALMLNDRVPVFDYYVTWEPGIAGLAPLVDLVNVEAEALVEVRVHHEAYEAARKPAVEVLRRLPAIDDVLAEEVAQELSSFDYQWQPRLDELGPLDDRSRQLASFRYGALLFHYYAESISDRRQPLNQRAEHVLHAKRARVMLATSLTPSGSLGLEEARLFKSLRRVEAASDGAVNAVEVRLPRGDYRDDPTLTTAANNALTSNATVPPGIEATARDGNLELIGTVGFGSQRAAAERAVAELTGVRNIKDHIDIDPGVDPTNILYLVRGVLDRYAVVDDDSNVEVTTTGATVTLTGSVRTWAEHDAVVDAAWMAGGVADVRDELSVTG